MLGIMGIAGLVFTFRLTRAARHHDEAGFTRGQVRKRLLFPTVAYIMMVFSGAGVFVGIPEMLYTMVGAMCMLLGNASGTSWELLVHIARQRRAAHRG